jgi:hypothetical protein
MCIGVLADVEDERVKRYAMWRPDMMSSPHAVGIRMWKTLGVSCAATLTLWSVPSEGQPRTEPVLIDVQKLGPQVGAHVPDFNLNDQHGAKQTLQSVMGPKGAILVFFRSADW